LAQAVDGQFHRAVCSRGGGGRGLDPCHESSSSAAHPRDSCLLIDTAVDYGRSEELIGRYLGSRRSEFFLASNCGCPVSLPPDAVTTTWT
jgi:hypothetical protein